MTTLPQGYTPTCQQCGRWFLIAKALERERDEARAGWPDTLVAGSLLDEARAELEAVVADRDFNLAAKQKAEDERDRLRALLREVEWICVCDTSGDWYWTCPVCLVDRDVRGGHVVGCRLAAALEERNA